MIKNRIYIVSCFMIFISINIQAQLVGHWNFNDSDNLLKAEVGKDLVLHGSHKAVLGTKDGDGAVRIGLGSYYFVNHEIAASKGNKRVNEFSLVFDVKIPKKSLWYTLFQEDLTNKNDGNWFIKPEGNLGVGGTNYSETALKENEWYRVGISVKNREHYDYYLDGFRVFKGLPMHIDGIYSLDTEGLLLFTDNRKQDNEFDIADVKLFSNALSDKEMKELGGYHDKPIYKIAPPDSAIYPYLQSPTESSIYISWHASNSPKSLIKYGETEKLELSQLGGVHIFGDSTTYHTVKLENLQPNTTYYYQAISDTMKSKIFKFKTAPSLGEKKGHIRFAIFGDTRTYPTRTKDVMTSIREKVTELYGNPNIEENLNLVLCNGDVVHYGPTLSQYKREWFMPMSMISANVPIMVTIGDHEHEADEYYEYMKYEDFAGPLGERHYAYKYGRVLFVADHSITNYMNNVKDYRETKLNWLNNVLQKAEVDSTIDWVIVFTHRPGHSEFWVNGNESYVQNDLIPLLSKYSKVDILTYGHTHAYERGQVTNGSFRLLESGGGGAEIGKWLGDDSEKDYPEIQRAHNYWCYTIIDIDIENKKYEAKSYGLGNDDITRDNELFDSFFRDKANETPPQKPVGKTEGSVASPVKLSASTYSGNYEILSSQFQVTSEKGNYDDLIINSKRDFENIYFDSGAPDFIPLDKNSGIDLTQCMLENNKLEVGRTYWWRVRYRDKNLQWSEWSDEVSVTAKGGMSLN